MDYARGPRDREPVTTIAWRLGHLTVAFAATNAHFGGPPADHATSARRGLPGRRVLFLYINLEIIHHGAEISLLRDLYLRHDSQDHL